MRKNVLFLFMLIMCLSFTACSETETNNEQSKDSKNDIVTEDISFTESEIQEAEKCVREKFKKDYKGCKLIKIYYDENMTKEEIKYRINTEIDEITTDIEENLIILNSEFKTDSSHIPSKNSNFSPNTTYSNWRWILERDDISGKWEVKGWGL